MSCSDGGDTGSLEDLKHNSHSTSEPEYSLPGEENNLLLSPPSNPVFIQVLKWDELDSNLQLVLPPDEKYTYVVETYHQNDKM